MKFLKKIQKELTRTMKIKFSKSKFKCESNLSSSIHDYSSNKYTKISFYKLLINNKIIKLK